MSKRKKASRSAADIVLEIKAMALIALTLTACDNLRKAPADRLVVVPATITASALAAGLTLRELAGVLGGEADRHDRPVGLFEDGAGDDVYLHWAMPKSWSEERQDGWSAGAALAIAEETGWSEPQEISVAEYERRKSAE